MIEAKSINPWKIKFPLPEKDYIPTDNDCCTMICKRINNAIRFHTDTLKGAEKVGFIDSYGKDERLIHEGALGAMRKLRMVLNNSGECECYKLK